MAKEVDAAASKLSELKNHSTGFDIIVTCTSSSEPVLCESIFDKLVNGEETKKVIIDLAIPGDVADEVLEKSKSSLESELSTLKKDEENLASDIQKLKDPEYISKFARENYMYSKDGEYIIKIEDKNGNIILNNAFSKENV